ncbi:sensor histidine kinase [Emticicia sp. 17c]|uniref:sensor histidine kinase n=1 Tax=Emticicia sp. 17c TaxID=3127704 RepID=UPI00301BE37E
MKAFFSAVLFILVTGLALARTNPVFELKQGFKESTLDGYALVFNTQKPITADSILKSKDSIFRFTTSTPTFVANQEYHWLKLEFQSFINQQLILELQQVFVDSVEFWAYEGDSLIASYASSWLLTFQEKAIASRYHAFGFGVKQQKHYTLLIRCRNNKIHFSTRAFLVLFAEKQHQYNNDSVLFYDAFFNGSTLLISLLSLLFFFYSGRKIYFYYWAYVFLLDFYLFSSSGYLNEFFNPKTSFFASINCYLVLLTGTIMFHELYIYDFLKIKFLKKKFLQIIHYVFVGICLLQILFVAFLPVHPVPFWLIYFYFAFNVLLFLWMGISRKQIEAYLYLAASGPMFIAFLLVALSSLSIIPIFSFLYYYSNMALVLESFGLGFALIYVFNKEKEKIQAELEKNRLETTHKILLAQEEERQKLALDLHDDLGGSLSVLNRELDELNQENNNILNKPLQLVNKIVIDLRTISHHLMPSSFEEKGLRRVVEESIEMANRQSKTSFIFLCNGQEKKLAMEAEVNIYRIVKELLNNTLKHAEAKNVVLQMIYFPELLYISVEDDGKGFDFSATESWGIGIKNINLRASYLKANLNIESSPGRTLISLEIPYNADPNKDSVSG